MNKELSDRVWKILPKEFKEEVKIEYKYCLHCNKNASAIKLEQIFGHHNLTSDSEGEEMLCVKASTVRDMYAANDRLIADHIGGGIERQAALINEILRTLFGSKCLPDEGTNCTPDEKPLTQNPPENCDNANHISKSDNKPAGPKYKVGDKVVFKCSDGDVIQTIHGCKYDGIMKDWIYNFAEGGPFFDDGFFEPYTEPTETCTETCTDDCSSHCKSQSGNLSQNIANCDKQSDHFAHVRKMMPSRLHIAAMAMQGMLSNAAWTERKMSLALEAEENDMTAAAEILTKEIAEDAVEFADVLIAECKKGH